jgi:hypothetical protein
MATKKKNSRSDPESKTDCLREVDDLWGRLDDLGEAFHRAAVRDRSEDLAQMGHILRSLEEEPEFREIAHASLRSHLSKKHGERMLTRQHEEELLFQLVFGALVAESANADRRSIPVEFADREHPTQSVAIIIMQFLPLFPTLYGRTEGPPITRDFLLHPGDDDHDLQPIVERVRRAIAPKLVGLKREDAKSFEKTAKSAVRAAMRELGADPGWVKNMFQNP